VAAYDKDPRAEREWSGRRPGQRLLAAMLLASLLLPLYIGWVLDRCIAADGAGATLACLIGNNLAFQAWQFEGSSVLLDHTAWEPWLQQLGQFASPRWALVWDLLFIAAYASVLARGVTWAFARVAGLRAVDKPTPRWLNRLGWALPLMVLADLCENLLGFVAIGAVREQLAILQWLGGLLAGLAALASVAKYTGLAGVLALMLWGAASRSR
jgi:hypothetical protein